MEDLLNKKCAAQHFGLWLAETDWFMQTFQAIRTGLMKPIEFHVAAKEPATPTPQVLYRLDTSGIAHIGIMGMMTKGTSSYGGTSTITTRQAVRQATIAEDVKAILLHIDSNGGTVAGTAALVDDVKAAARTKPMHAHFEDAAASAAYWVGSQAQKITAERTSNIGSIGTFAYVVDTSGEFEKNGWVAHVISTGKFKGAGAAGKPITDDEISYLQQRVNDINNHFITDVAEGRGMTTDQVTELADGRVHEASKAKAIGLIDAVQTVDETIAGIRQQIYEDEQRAGQQRNAVAQVLMRK